MSIAINELTGTEQTVLLTLMAECRVVPNPELASLGPSLEKPGRDKLVRYGLIEVTKPGRAMALELTDKGWQTCRRIIEAGEAPHGSKPQAKALYTLLRSLNRYFVRNDLVLSEVFGPASAAVLESVAAEPHPVAPVAPAPAPRADIAEHQVRSSYQRLAANPGGWVGLVRLRAELAGLSRAEQDVVLRQLFRAPDVSLIPEENQKVLTAEDRAAAIEIGGENKHLIAIDA